jgi:Holliday junction resolvasome RuvABC endonuclease subunit
MFVGIDQALGHTGVAVVGDAGDLITLRTIVPRGIVGVARLAYIRDELTRTLSGLTLRQAAVEGYAYEAIGRTFDLGEVGGVVRLLLHDLHVPFLVVAPAALKKYVSGNPQASKERMRVATHKKWGIDIDQDDACDAYGLARVARTYAVGKSLDRDELEVVQKLKSPPARKPGSARGRIKLSL